MPKCSACVEISSVPTSNTNYYDLPFFFQIAGAHDVQEPDDSDKEEVGIKMAESGLTTALSVSIVLSACQLQCSLYKN